MSSDQDIKDVLWRAFDLMRQDGSDVVLPVLLTVVGLKVLSDSEPWFVARGYDVPELARWVKLKHTPHLATAVGEALKALTTNPSLCFLREADPAWFAREELLSQLVLLIDTVDLSFGDLEAWRRCGRLMNAIMDHPLSKRWEELRTAPRVNDLVAALVTWHSFEDGGTVYDATCGLGGTLVSTWEAALGIVPDWETLAFYGQDVSSHVLYACTWNLLLHGLTRFQLARGDVFSAPNFLAADNRVQTFDRVVSDPPWGLLRKVEWGADPYQRFRYGPLRGRRADYGFVQHALASLNASGQALMLLPVSALLRSGFEQDIRRNLVQADVIDAVVTLPAGAFVHTGVSAVLLVFRYQKEAGRRQMIRMIDAAGTFGDRRPVLDDALVDRIVQSVQSPNEEVGFAQTVAVEDIARQDFSLLPGAYFNRSVALVSLVEIEQKISERLVAYDEANRVLKSELDRLAKLLRS